MSSSQRVQSVLATHKQHELPSQFGTVVVVNQGMSVHCSVSVLPPNSTACARRGCWQIKVFAMYQTLFSYVFSQNVRLPTLVTVNSTRVCSVRVYRINGFVKPARDNRLNCFRVSQRKQP